MSIEEIIAYIHRHQIRFNLWTYHYPTGGRVLWFVTIEHKLDGKSIKVERDGPDPAEVIVKAWDDYRHIASHGFQPALIAQPQSLDYIPGEANDK